MTARTEKIIIALTILIALPVGIYLLAPETPAQRMARMSADAEAAHDRTASPMETRILIDVRTEEEYQEGHLPGAVHLDWYSPTFLQDVARLDKTASYDVYCRTGARSTEAVRIMTQLGFRDAQNVEGGIVRLLAEGGSLCTTC